jgi:hypothetical protein
MVKIQDIFLSIINDQLFIVKCKSSIDTIMKDGKVDFSDIPEIVYLLTDITKTLYKKKLNSDEFEELFNMLYKHVTEKYKFIPENNNEMFEKMLKSSLKLAMFKPKISKSISCLQ